MKMSELAMDLERAEGISALRRFCNGADTVDLNEVQADHDSHTIRECIKSLMVSYSDRKAHQFVCNQYEQLIEAREELNGLLSLLESTQTARRIAAE